MFVGFQVDEKVQLEAACNNDNKSKSKPFNPMPTLRYFRMTSQNLSCFKIKDLFVKKNRWREGGGGFLLRLKKNPLHLLSHFFPRYLLSLSLSDSDSDEKELRSSFLFNGFKPTPNFPIVSQQMDFQLESCPCCYPRYLCSALSKKMHPCQRKEVEMEMQQRFSSSLQMERKGK